MKKVLVLLVALICFGATSNAQVCKISGSNDSVEVFDSYLDAANNQIVVTVGNDSNDISANVTVTVQVRVYNNGWSTQTFTGKTLAKPNQTTTIKIKPTGGYMIKDDSKIIKVDISGTKCNQ